MQRQCLKQVFLSFHNCPSLTFKKNQNKHEIAECEYDFQFKSNFRKNSWSSNFETLTLFLYGGLEVQILTTKRKIQ